MFLAVLSTSLQEEALEDGSSRTVLNLPAFLAPYKVAILPLLKKDGLPEKARDIVNLLKFDHMVQYDEKDAIGKRYRRQDAAGTPLCVTVDHQSLEDNTITVRFRDSMEQIRIPIASLSALVKEKVSLSAALQKL
jgi:glycyl-tRNA synthetase